MVRRMNGFSLIELLMVICVLTLISAIATPSLLNWRSSAKLRGAASNLKGDMELARLKAIQVNDRVAIHFTTTSYRVFKDDGPTSGQNDAGEEIYGDRNLPAGVKIDLAQTNFDDESARFFGRGTARSGSAFLVNDKGTEKKVTVNSLGRITITDND